MRVFRRSYIYGRRLALRVVPHRKKYTPLPQPTFHPVKTIRDAPTVNSYYMCSMYGMDFHDEEPTPFHQNIFEYEDLYEEVKPRKMLTANFCRVLAPRVDITYNVETGQWSHSTPQD